MRVGFFHRSKSGKCPNDEFVPHKLKYYYACRAKASGSCASVPLETYGVTYTDICGAVYGYQAGATAAFDSTADINSPYLSGVSITRTVTGPEKRRHVFSLAAGEAEKSTSQYACPCNAGATHKPPAFVGDDYYCESGSPDVPTSTAILGGDRLWDERKLQHAEAKCKKPLMPLFKSSISPGTSDQLELRLCKIKQEADVYLEHFYVYIH